MATNDDIDNAGQQASNVGNITAQVVGQMKSLLDVLSEVGQKGSQAFTNVSLAANPLGDSIDNSLKSLKILNTEWQSMGANVPRAIDGMIDKFVQFGKFFLNNKMFEGFAKDATNQFQTIEQSTQATTSIIAGVLGKTLPDSMKKYITEVKNGIDHMAIMATGGQQLEAGFYKMLAASGQLDKAFDAQSGSLIGLSAISTSYVAKLAEIANATNRTVNETVQFATSLDKIPGMMDSLVRTDTEEKLDTTTAALRLMSGTAQTSDAIIKEFAEAQTQLGQANGRVSDSSQKAAEFIATISEVSKEANLNFDDAHGYLGKVADQFKFVGDNTASAAGVMQGFSQALQETGLTAKASAEIVGDMVGKINGLNLGTKAFISMRGGGPGGLQGAFKIEDMLRHGNLDQVMQMMQKGLRQQLGGRIYSLDEAQQSPQAAAQFARQRMMVQSGVFGIGSGSTDAQATHILEALKNGNVNLLKDTMKTGQEAVKDISQKGLEVQQRNNTVLNTVARLTERAAMAAEITAGIEMRKAGGIDSGFAKNIISEMNQATANAREAGGKENLNSIGSPDEEAAKLTMGLGHQIRTGIGDVFSAGAHLVKNNLPIENKELSGPTTLGHQQVQAAHTIVQKQKEQEQKVQHNVRLKVEVTAPPGFGINTTTPDKNVDVVDEINSRGTLNGGVPGY